uniref:Uncharacterized protein n=1 Tax=Arundo donax TaxID=35708 RepID=A0A0A9C1F2_ARUDO
MWTRRLGHQLFTGTY